MNIKTEILYGIHPVFEALKADRRNFFELYIAKDKTSKRLEGIMALVESKRIPVRRIKHAQIKSIAGSNLHQGIAASVSPYPLVELADIIDKPGLNDTGHFLLLLDNILDPHNLGAMIRTGLCTGIDGIVIPKDRSASPTPAVSRISAGALEHIFLAQVTNLVNTIKTLKKKKLWIAGMDRVAKKSVFSCDFSDSVAIVVGGEEKGMRPLVKKHCDLLISIPQKGQINSLNASVAGAVVMYEAFRQRALLFHK